MLDTLLFVVGSLVFLFGALFFIGLAAFLPVSLMEAAVDAAERAWKSRSSLSRSFVAIFLVAGLLSCPHHHNRNSPVPSVLPCDEAHQNHDEPCDEDRD